VTLSYGAGEEKDKKVWRRKGMRDFSRRSLLSFVLKCCPLRGILGYHYSCTAYAKWGVEGLNRIRWNLPQ